MPENLMLSKKPTVQTGMGIRRPPHEVFRAFVDPALTTRFWFTKSSGRLERDATVEWVWEMYDASAKVHVTDIDENRRLVFDWGDGETSTTVEFQFVPWGEDGTYVRVRETGLTGDADALAARAADSTGGFTIALCAAKALLEHDIALTVVADRYPEGVEH